MPKQKNLIGAVSKQKLDLIFSNLQDAVNELKNYEESVSSKDAIAHFTNAQDYLKSAMSNIKDLSKKWEVRRLKRE